MKELVKERRNVYLTQQAPRINFIYFNKITPDNNLSCNVSVTHSKGLTPNPMKLCKFFVGFSGSGTSFRRIK